jgi:hypothetical protein
MQRDQRQAVHFPPPLPQLPQYLQLVQALQAPLPKGMHVATAGSAQQEEACTGRGEWNDAAPIVATDTANTTNFNMPTL